MCASSACWSEALGRLWHYKVPKTQPLPAPPKDSHTSMWPQPAVPTHPADPAERARAWKGTSVGVRQSHSIRWLGGSQVSVHTWSHPRLGTRGRESSLGCQAARPHLPPPESSDVPAVVEEGVWVSRTHRPGSAVGCKWMRVPHSASKKGELGAGVGGGRWRGERGKRDAGEGLPSQDRPCLKGKETWQAGKSERWGKGGRGFSAVGALSLESGALSAGKGGCPRLIFSWSSRSFALGAAAAGERGGGPRPAVFSRGCWRGEGGRGMERGDRQGGWD